MSNIRATLSGGAAHLTYNGYTTHLGDPNGDYLSGPFYATPSGALSVDDWNGGAADKCQAAFDLASSNTVIGTGTCQVLMIVFFKDAIGVNPLSISKVTIYDSGFTVSQTSGALRLTDPIQLQASNGQWYELSIVLAETGSATFQLVGPVTSANPNRFADPIQFQATDGQWYPVSLFLADSRTN